MSAMLMSWYMSGYYTGLYHGRKQAREENPPHSTTDIQREAATSSERGSPHKKKKTRRTHN
jgi:hypothetical protein